MIATYFTKGAYGTLEQQIRARSFDKMVSKWAITDGDTNSHENTPNNNVNY